MNSIDRFYSYVQAQPWERGRLDKASHDTFLRAASLKIDAKTAINVVAERIQAAGGHLRPRKLERQLRNALRYVGTTAGQATCHQPPRPKLVFKPEKLAKFAAKRPEIVDDDYLAAKSKFTCWNRTPAGFLHKLYLPGEKVLCFNVFASQGCAVWQHPGPTGDLSTLNWLQEGQRFGAWFMSNPVHGEYIYVERLQSRHNPKGKSRRCGECATAWRYAVLESDKAPADLWLKAIVQLPLPVSAIYRSGKKSMHVLLRIDAVCKAQWDEIVRVKMLPDLVTFLGACDGSLSAVRLTRLPNCWREETGRLQKLLYLDDDPDGVPIFQKPVRDFGGLFSCHTTQTLNHLFQQEGISSNGDSESRLSDVAKGLDIYYDSSRTSFWVKNDRGGWMRVTTEDVKRRAKALGFKGGKEGNDPISQVDALLVAIQEKNDVDYADSLAGYDAGIYLINEKRILVRDSPKLIQPVEGDWPLLTGILLRMLGKEQMYYLYGWLKVAVESLYRAESRRLGQALVLAGPRDCGKSLLQGLITILLGGRCSKPHRYMSGLTPFNGELIGCEHLVIEDEEASTDIRARRNFGTKIKEICANTSHSAHHKNRPAVTLTPFWRLSISVNDEPENLMILPPIDESLEDKLIILKAEKHPMPMPTVTDQDREAFMGALGAELPHFIADLLQWDIPEKLKSHRYGVTHFQHPDILEAISAMTPETRLLELIEIELFSSPAAGSWEGSANKLEQRLTSESSDVKRETMRLLTFPTACGTYLGRLRKPPQTVRT